VFFLADRGLAYDVERRAARMTVVDKYWVVEMIVQDLLQSDTSISQEWS